MGFRISSKDYMQYLKNAAKMIDEHGDYITKLDAATGDGDHWTNISKGFEKLVSSAEELEQLPISDCFKRIGMLMMSTIGGSSGILYGGAYLAAAKKIEGKQDINSQELFQSLDAMVHSMMERGKAKPGYKTMIDALYPAVEAYQACMEKGLDETETLQAVKQAAIAGAQSTREMEAVRGRACYQANKGVGHIDPGAVTMSYQLSALVDTILGTIQCSKDFE
ncbi:dihydroxyacetone kinase subunit DhaL [Brevibacillus sp. B_LB10_24]|uniref:dihydroxyacetone kinase subunit DhaL n=1 Tax=Brevibacillus sp. B_LB10_24 TaxID=3380645 RepID=UPI0038B8FE3E